MPNGYAVFETWFEKLTGFSEESPEQVRANLSVDGQVLQSHVNGKTLICGELETPSLADLRQRVQASGYETGAMTVREVVADVQGYTQTRRMRMRCFRSRPSSICLK